MTPQLAARIVAEFSPGGGLVIDPFTCGDGAVVAAAARAGRCSIAVSPDRHRLARVRIRVEEHGPAEGCGVAGFRCGDARDLTSVCADVAGWVDLIATCPPHQCVTWPRPGDPDDRYSCATGTVLAECARLLKPGGLLVTVTTNAAGPDGRMSDQASLNIALARQAGFRYLQHIIALRSPIAGDALAPPPPGAHGPRQIRAHSDVLAFVHKGDAR